MSIRPAGDSLSQSSTSKLSFCLCDLLIIEKGLEILKPLVGFTVHISRPGSFASCVLGRSYSVCI